MTQPEDAAKSGVHRIAPSDGGTIKNLLENWNIAADQLSDGGPGIAHHETRAYYKQELASMLSQIAGKWGAADQWYVMYRNGTLFVVARLDVRNTRVTLSHVMGRPRTMPNVDPGNPSPLSRLMDQIKIVARPKGGLKLNAEVLSLIPLYRHYGFRMTDLAKEQAVAEFADTVTGNRQAQNDAWAVQCEAWAKAGWNVPEMHWTP